MSYRNYSYDTSSYGRSRDRSTSDRPTSVTAKYLTITPAYKSSSIPILRRDLSATRDETPITSIANRYSSYKKDEKPSAKYEKPVSKYDKKEYEKPVSKYDKKDYSKLSVPSTPINRSRDVSPVSTSSKYSLSRTSRHSSPDRKTSLRSPDPSTDRDKDIPSKTEKSTGYNSLSSYKLYPRSSSYSRPSSRAETKPDISVNRYSITNRLSSNYLRSPSVEKRTSVSPVLNHIESAKPEIEKPVTPVVIVEEEPDQSCIMNEEPSNNSRKQTEDEDEYAEETITVITRHTSPTPPGSSVYVRTRRADMAKTIEKTVTRLKRRPEMIDKAIQLEKLDDQARNSRFGPPLRSNVGTWTLFTPSSSHYTGYAGRYSTNYTNIRDNSISGYCERSSRSRSTEPAPLEKVQTTNYRSESKERETKPIENTVTNINNVTNINPEMITVYEKQNKDDDTSEIIINVNLKLKKAKNPSTELVSPEVTITNSQLPPQAPKPDGAPKTKKIKVRKTSTDSTSDSSTGSKKKIVKKRSKSVSSSDSEQVSESSSTGKAKSKVSETKNMIKTTSSSNLVNGNAKLKHSKSRESNSPESIITLSTQSSISEDEPTSKSKTSRTSADEMSIPTDRSGKQSSPPANQKNEGTEEAKSFLIRALAPVTNLFKTRNQDSNDSRWLADSTSESTGKDISNLVTESDRSSKSNTDNIVASNDDNLVKLKGIRHIESGERAWWLDSDSEKKSSSNNITNDNAHSSSDKNIPRKIRHIESGERAWWMESSGTENKSEPPKTQTESSDRPYRKGKYDDEKPWWLDSNANVPEGVERLTPPRKTLSESEKSEKFDFFKVHRIESGDKKDWWITSSENSSSNKQQEHQGSLSKSGSDQRSFPLRRIRHVESGERPWWLSSSKNIPEGVEKLPTPPPQSESSSDSEEVQAYVPPSQIPPFPLSLPDDEPLGDRRSPEGLETPKEPERYQGRVSPYENNRQYRRHSSSNLGYQKAPEKYISRYTDIDDILGTSSQIYSPFMDSMLARRTGQAPYDGGDDDECEEIDSTQVKIHDSTAQRPVIKKMRSRSEIIDCRDEDQLDDAALQVFKDGEYGPYLDLDSTLGEQEEELAGLQDSRKNAIILRTQLSVRVHALIERLLQSQGRELRRALFSLKQVLQSDDDLVHEFVANKGLDALMQLGNMADHNYLDYILRALGQILLYVDGMLGVMAHQRCVQWLYSLVASKFRHVVKTALKLLLVFVEYTDENCLLLIDAISAVDNSNGRQPWNNVMKILQDVDASDTELLIYATNLINKCLNNIPDRNVYYDHVDALQDQGMDDIIQLYMSKQGTDLDLLRQLQIFEAVLLYEDGDESGTALKQLDDSVINSVRRRSTNLNPIERRKSKKQQIKEMEKQKLIIRKEPEVKPVITRSSLPSISDNKENKELTTALKRRRDRYARQAHHITQQQELLNNSSSIYNGIFNSLNNNNDIISDSFTSINGNNTSSKESFASINSSMDSFTSCNGSFSNGNIPNGNGYKGSNGGSTPTTSTICSYKTNTSGIYTSPNGGTYPNSNGNLNGNFKGSSILRKLNGPNGHQEEDNNCSPKSHDALVNGNQRYTAGLKQRIQNGTLGHSVSGIDALAVMRQKGLENIQDTKEDRGIILTKEHSIKDLAQRLTSPVSPTSEDKPSRVADMAGIVSKAKEELAKSQSKEVIKSPTIEILPKVHEIKISENDLHWEELKKGCLHREYTLCDLDFSDLKHDSDDELPLVPNTPGIPPPPPPAMFPLLGAPPPPPVPIPPFPRNVALAPPPRAPMSSELSNDSDSSTIKKNKKTVKLFWREIQENPPSNMRKQIGGFIWDDLPDVNLDTKMLEHLFESRTNDLIIKEKISEPKRNLILDAKRSNAINIAMKKLPTPQTIKAAIMKMDATVIGREGIEKLLTMLPSDAEKVKIQEAQYANPDLPLGSAEQFLLTLASISELSSRLKLWVFKLDFDNLEKEVAEPLMDLKQGIELLKVNKTFKAILSTLRSVGSFLNGSHVKGFRLEYLSKVMEVKDTVHKHPLLYHICEMIIEKFPDSTDFFSEVGPVIRASKVDFDVLASNLYRLEADCKASWDHMKKVSKHDGSQMFRTKINEFLTDAAERIILLSVIKKRVMNRYSKFLLYLGVPPVEVDKTKPSDFLKVIAEFALEFRTSRERVLLQLEKKANHRERNKTRGKMIIDVGNYSAKNGDGNSADHALKELLKTDPYTDSISDSRRKLSQTSHTRPLINGDMTAEDEIFESLVRSATSKQRPLNRERKRQSSDKKKSLSRRTISPSGQQTWPARENGPGSGIIQQR